MIKNVLLAILLLVQVVIWFVMDAPWKSAPEKSETVKNARMSDFDPAQAVAIQVVDPTGASLDLVKVEGVWTLSGLHGFPAIQTKVASALEQLSDLSKSEFRTGKRFLHEDLQVDPVHGQKLRFYGPDNRLLLDLIVGKQDLAGSRGTFVREAASDDTFVCRSQQLVSAFSTVLTQWYEPTMMDVELANVDRMTALRNACFRIDVETMRPKRGEDGQIQEPIQNERLRFVYERVDPAEGTGDPTWKVVEPAGKEGLVLDDLLVKSLASAALNLRSTQVISNGTLPEQGLSEREELALRCELRFRENGAETVRVLEVGAEHAVAAVNGVNRPADRYARVAHPGDPLRQRFVYTIPAGTLAYFQRDPETFVRRAAPPGPESPPRDR